jgi:hypothetical protein
MIPSTTRRPVRRSFARRAGAATAIALSTSLAFGGCFGTIGKVINAAHALANAAGNLKNLQSQIRKGENAAYEATYKTTGSSETSTVTFAQEPGGKYAYLVPGTNGAGGTEFVANGKNQYDCSQDSSGGKWTCAESAELSSTAGLEGDPFFGFTGAYVYTILTALEVEAAVAGYKVGNSKTSVAGISLKCVSLSGKSNGQTESYEWCVTNDGILGLVRDTSSKAGSNSSFELTHLSRSPQSSLFEPPSGATVTTQPT